jgi:glucosamine 6-phosphate synthetase-like amidotransferase/phosphosugar isomerase protein
MQLFDDDDYMMTTPKENFFQVLRTANQNIVENELEKLIERLAVAERMLEEKGMEEEYEAQVRALPVTDPEEIENRKNSLFIETVGNIVTQCE